MLFVIVLRVLFGCISELLKSIERLDGVVTRAIATSTGSEKDDVAAVLSIVIPNNNNKNNNNGFKVRSGVERRHRGPLSPWNQE